VNPRLQAGRYSGAIVLADISGYTAFLDSVRVAHQDDEFADGRIPDAYALMSSLLDGIASNIDPPLALVKFEGDAVFAVAPDEAAPRRGAMLECVQGCYRDFRTHLGRAGTVWTCTCNACGQKDSLDLKFVVHHGDYFVQAVGSHVEVLGPDVNIAHRLLKNSASRHIGSAAYALFTETAVDALGLALTDAIAITEPIDGMQPLGVRVIPLHE
jgi:class 3 adenylate cyclase